MALDATTGAQVKVFKSEQIPAYCRIRSKQADHARGAGLNEPDVCIAVFCVGCFDPHRAGAIACSLFCPACYRTLGRQICAQAGQGMV
jgi:hypothetical protein